MVKLALKSPAWLRTRTPREDVACKLGLYIVHSSHGKASWPWQMYETFPPNLILRIIFAEGGMMILEIIVIIIHTFHIDNSNDIYLLFDI
jgi:hypothetical protein